MADGVVYCLSNASMPGLLKFGFTRDTCVKRAIDLYSTGVPEPFKIEKYVSTSDASSLEKDIHKILAMYRHRADREFFKLEVDAALEMITKERPELTWSEGHEYDLKSELESRTQSKLFDDNLTAFTTINSDAIAFRSFMKDHNWFPNKGDFESEINNKSEYEDMIEKPLGYIDQGIQNYAHAKNTKIEHIRADTTWIRKELATIQGRLQSMKKRFEPIPSESSPCRCYRCERDYERTFISHA